MQHKQTTWLRCGSHRIDVVSGRSITSFGGPGPIVIGFANFRGRHTDVAQAGDSKALKLQLTFFPSRGPC